jgi:hypothetical protein
MSGSLPTGRLAEEEHRIGLAEIAFAMRVMLKAL